ncbi:MAG: hypothetical protein KBD64_07855 [Gammaproteobacteria bacterium]|nr:hypothetical protein [Gammaproteobacteria bacterium]
MSNLLDFFKNETLAFSFFIDTWLIAMFTEDELKAKFLDAALVADKQQRLLFDLNETIRFHLRLIITLEDKFPLTYPWRTVIRKEFATVEEAILFIDNSHLRITELITNLKHRIYLFIMKFMELNFELIAELEQNLYLNLVKLEEERVASVSKIEHKATMRAAHKRHGLIINSELSKFMKQEQYLFVRKSCQDIFLLIQHIHYYQTQRALAGDYVKEHKKTSALRSSAKLKPAPIYTPYYLLRQALPASLPLIRTLRGIASVSIRAPAVLAQTTESAEERPVIMSGCPGLRRHK